MSPPFLVRQLHPSSSACHASTGASPVFTKGVTCASSTTWCYSPPPQRAVWDGEGRLERGAEARAEAGNSGVEGPKPGNHLDTGPRLRFKYLVESQPSSSKCSYHPAWRDICPNRVLEALPDGRGARTARKRSRSSPASETWKRPRVRFQFRRRQRLCQSGHRVSSPKCGVF